jgi:hypothetical protein
MKRSLKQRIAFGRKLGFSAKDARALARLERARRMCRILYLPSK